MDQLIKDIRFGIRNLLRRPGFAAVALITLALGIGANTAIFSVVNAVLLRPLPFKDSQQVVMVWNKGVEAAGGDRTPLALINKTFERRFFQGVDPIGKRINLGSERDPNWNQIVGVVDDVKYNGLAEEVQPAIYQAAVQAPSWGMALIVKTDVGDPLSLTPAIREQVRQIDPQLPIASVKTLDDRIDVAMAESRFRTTLIALFAVVALVLASVGVYGVISYSVTRRTHEFGIRMALGAQRTDVLQMVLRQALVFAIVGVALGLAGAFALNRLISSLLFGVSANDPVTFASVAGFIVAVAFIACYIPARRATKVDPLVALRNE